MSVRRLLIPSLVVLAPLGATVALVAGRDRLQRRLVRAGVARARAAAGLEPREAAVDGHAMAWLERPGPGPTVALVHGFNGGKDGWLRYAEHVPPDWHLVVPDLPGHGESGVNPSTDYDPPALAHTLLAWLDIVAPGRVHLAGSSLGGELATRVALDHPDRIASLALFNPAGVHPPEPSDMDRLADAEDYVLIPTTRAELDRLYAHVFVEPPDLPVVARTVFAAEAAARAPFMRGLLAHVGANRDALRARIGDLAVPTLLLWGDCDRVLHPSSAQVWAEALPPGTLHVLAGVGHAPMLEAPAETARLHAALVADAVGAA